MQKFVTDKPHQCQLSFLTNEEIQKSQSVFGHVYSLYNCTMGVGALVVHPIIFNIHSSKCLSSLFSDTEPQYPNKRLPTSGLAFSAFMGKTLSQDPHGAYTAGSSPACVNHEIIFGEYNNGAYPWIKRATLSLLVDLGIVFTFLLKLILSMICTFW